MFAPKICARVIKHRPTVSEISDENITNKATRTVSSLTRTINQHLGLKYDPHVHIKWRGCLPVSNTKRTDRFVEFGVFPNVSISIYLLSVLR